MKKLTKLAWRIENHLRTHTLSYIEKSVIVLFIITNIVISIIVKLNM